MDTTGYSEYVGVGDAASRDTPQELVVSYCDLEAANRCKEEVRFGPGLAPSAFRSSIICYENCSKRKFISRVECTPRLTPRRFASTFYVRPRHVVETCATFLELPSELDNKGNWFKSSVLMEPRTYSSCKVQGTAAAASGIYPTSGVDFTSGLEFTKIVEEKHVTSDGSVKIHIENYRNGELITVSDLRKRLSDDDVTMTSQTDSDVIDMSSSVQNPRIQEALDTLNSSGKERGVPGSPVHQDLIWMDGVLDKDSNIIPLRPEDSPDLFYQADDEENEILTDDNANVTHHLKKRRTTARRTAACAQSPDENSCENSRENSREADWYQSGPFVYGVPRRHRGRPEPRARGEEGFKHMNGFADNHN